MKELIGILNEMKSDRIANYVIAGLDSHLLENGKIRLFENSRDHQDSITPHSHRFDFSCLVIRGSVLNRVWSECDEDSGDYFQSSTLDYSGEIGDHEVTAEGRWRYDYCDTCYMEGDVYSMKSDEIHSIQFSKAAIVLFFEGPQKSSASKIIEPVVNGVLIPTYEKKSYMFIRS